MQLPDCVCKREVESLRFRRKKQCLNLCTNNKCIWQTRGCKNSPIFSKSISRTTFDICSCLYFYVNYDKFYSLCSSPHVHKAVSIGIRDLPFSVRLYFTFEGTWGYSLRFTNPSSSNAFSESVNVLKVTPKISFHFVISDDFTFGKAIQNWHFIFAIDQR